MAIRSAQAEWKGNLSNGRGTVKTETGALDGAYSFASRFESGTGTNPEELIAAAHAACYSMALSHGLAQAGFEPSSVRTSAGVHLDKVEGGFQVSRIDLTTEAEVPGIEEAAFQEQARAAKEGCPISKLLAAAEITLKATLHA